MHCPTCRADNAATTRFCTSCGAVLVEEAPGGGRRRVLRPWGLRRSAPLTVSPDFPDLAQVPVSGDEGRSRIDLWLAGGIAAIVLVVAALHPSLRRAEATSTSHAEERVVAAPASVATPAVALVKETRLAAPALVERAAPKPRNEAQTPKAKASSAATDAASGAARGPSAVPVAYAMAPREAVVNDGQGVHPAATVVAEPAPATVPDRWQALRADLESCRTLGVFDRSTCEQRARIDHCGSYWGHVPECPQWRSEVR